jgi:hypothetical protein
MNGGFKHDRGHIIRLDLITPVKHNFRRMLHLKQNQLLPSRRGRQIKKWLEGYVSGSYKRPDPVTMEILTGKKVWRGK